MDIPQEVVAKIREYSESYREIEQKRAATRPPSNSPSYDEYHQQVDRTLRSLRYQVQQREAALQKLRASTSLDLPRPDQTPRERLVQTRRAIKAYKSLESKPLDLPSPDSQLGSLLALRETNRLIREFKTSIPATANGLVNDRQRLDTEESNLRDEKAIAVGLQMRIESMHQNQLGTTSNRGPMRGKDKNEQTPNQLAKVLIYEERKSTANIDEKVTEMREELKEFINESLASMLAAEDMGGPVVGDQIDVADSTLEAGYTAKGKEKKPAKSKEAVNRDKSQQRIDELLRRRSEGADRGSESGRSNRAVSAKEAAAREMHSLIESLLDISATSSYLELDRDSAASRFLVKAKIAQFHPRDSQKLRLIDVARDIRD